MFWSNDWFFWGPPWLESPSLLKVGPCGSFVATLCSTDLRRIDVVCWSSTSSHTSSQASYTHHFQSQNNHHLHHPLPFGSSRHHIGWSHDVKTRCFTSKKTTHTNDLIQRSRLMKKNQMNSFSKRNFSNNFNEDPGFAVINTAIIRLQFYVSFFFDPRIGGQTAKSEIPWDPMMMVTRSIPWCLWK